MIEVITTDMKITRKIKKNQLIDGQVRNLGNLIISCSFLWLQICIYLYF